MGTGILGTRATLVADANLILQVVMLVMLLFAALQAKRGNLQLHCTLMTVVVVANGVAIIAIMNPAFFRSLPYALGYPGARGPRVLWPHVVAGTLSEAMGVYVVIAMRWGNSGSGGRLRNPKWTMRITALLWTVSLVAGIVVYYLRYVLSVTRLAWGRGNVGYDARWRCGTVVSCRLMSSY